MAEFIVVTWAVVQGHVQQHEESAKRLMNYWQKNAKRFKLKSLRYYSQAIGGDPFTLGRVMVYEYDSLADWEYFEKQMEEDKKAMSLKDQLFAGIDLKTRKVVEWQDKQRDTWFE
jgi:hypothetical protein